MSTIIEQLNMSGEENVLSPRRPLTEIQITSLRKDLEKLTSGMEITITFLPVLRMRHNSITLTDIALRALLSVLKRHDFTTTIVGEYSPTGMYHMHGLLYTDQGRTIDAIKRKLQREIGRVQIKAITWTEAYIDYILKDTKQGRKIYKDEIIKITTNHMKSMTNQALGEGERKR